MDGDGETGETGDPLPNGGDVLQPIRLRRDIQSRAGFNGFVLDYSLYFLPCCGVVFWIVFLLCQN